MRPDAMARLGAHALLQKLGGAVDDLRRNHLIFQDFLSIVDIVDEQVEGSQALDQALLQHLPLVKRDDARDDIHRPGAIDVLSLAVDGEGDTHLLDGQIGCVLPGDKVLQRLLAHERGQAPRRRPRPAGRTDYLIVKPARVVVGPVNRGPGA